MKKAIVIGASSGIGKELAVLLSENGFMVGITGRRTQLLDALKKQNPGSFIVSTFDITNLSDSTRSLEELTIELGGLDLLVVSSGTGEINEELDFILEKKTIETNILGFTNVVDWAFRFFQQKGHGHLTAISSISGIRGSRGAPAYNATKAFQINYLEGLRQKAYFIKKPIHITDVRPGFVDTEMAKGEGKFWVATPKKAAAQIFMAIKMKKKVVYITKRWAIIGLLLKVIPGFIYHRL